MNRRWADDDSGLLRRYLEEISKYAPIPAEREKELRPLDKLLKKMELRHGIATPIALWPMIETPLGVLNAQAIAAHPRVSALVAGVNDLSKGLKLRLEGNRQPLHHALQQIGRAHV